MSEKVKFEIQVETLESRHGWRHVGGRDSFIDLSNEDRIYTLVDKVEQAREGIKKLKRDDKRNWFNRKYRIVKVTIVTTYEIVE